LAQAISAQGRYFGTSYSGLRRRALSPRRSSGTLVGMGASVRAALVVAALGAGACATELTKETWDEAVAGKTVFVKFFAPWCGHCKRIKPDWDQLMAEYDGHATTLVADVDCDGDGKDLCDEVGVRGFPTIKHGDPSDLQDYEGGRSAEDLKKFADGLGPQCSPANLDLCDEEKKAKIAEFKALGAEKRADMIQEKEAEVAKLEADLEAFVEGLQKQYEEANKKKDEAIEAVKASGLGLLKSVQAHEKKAKSEL